MKISFVVGVVLLVVSLVAALFGIAGVGGTETAGAIDDQTPVVGSLWSWGLPVLSGLGLAIGGLLIGLSMGNWRHPRSHQEPGDEVVDPEGHHKMRHV